MDILVSSNLERLAHLSCGRDAAKTKAMMEQLSTNGKYEITADMKEFMKDFCAGYADMEEMRRRSESIRRYRISELTHTQALQQPFTSSIRRRPAIPQRL